ncbi:MAG: response regulator [Vicinamibacterales bacterium]
MAQNTPLPSGSQTEAPITVLLVDDQRFIGLALERLFSTEPDIQLHCCEKAEDAVSRANAIKPSIILQDLVMPGIDGLTLVALFRQNAATARTPIIVLSGNEDAGSRARSIAAGADDYLLKLPGKDELVACIRAHAGGGKTADAVSVVAPGRDLQSDITLDREVVALFCDMDGALSSFARSLIDQFIRDADSQIATLGDAARSQDSELLKATAHSLKGSSLTVGANRLGWLCRQLEEHINQHPDRSVSPALMAAVDAEFVLVRKAFGDL